MNFSPRLSLPFVAGLVGCLAALLTAPRAAAQAPEPTILDDGRFKVHALALGRDGKTLAWSANDSATLYDLAANKKRIALKVPGGAIDSNLSLALSPDGKTMAVGSTSNLVTLWDLETKELRFTLRGHTDWVQTVAFSPDSKLLASGGDETVRIWDVASGKLLRAQKTESSAYGLVFSPDGKTLAAVTADGGLSLRDVASGKLRVSLAAHEGAALCVAFSPDGKLLATGGADEVVKVWDPVTKEEKTVFKGHKDKVRCLAFSPDGQLLASGALDDTVRVWDLAAGKEKVSLPHPDSVRGLTFTADGKALITGCDDAKVRKWDFAGKPEK